MAIRRIILLLLYIFSIISKSFLIAYVSITVFLFLICSTIITGIINNRSNLNLSVHISKTNKSFFPLSKIVYAAIITAKSTGIITLQTIVFKSNLSGLFEYSNLDCSTTFKFLSSFFSNLHNSFCILSFHVEYYPDFIDICRKVLIALLISNFILTLVLLAFFTISLASSFIYFSLISSIKLKYLTSSNRIFN